MLQWPVHAGRRHLRFTLPLNLDFSCAAQKRLIMQRLEELRIVYQWWVIHCEALGVLYDRLVAAKVGVVWVQKPRT